METRFKEVTRQSIVETPKTKQKYVFSFHEGDGKNKQLLGGKGANFCEMTQIGLNVPPGFVISPRTCMSYLGNNKQLPEGVMDQVLKHMKKVEKSTGKYFGDT